MTSDRDRLRRMALAFLVLLAGLVILSPALRAQAAYDASGGTYYIVAFPDTVTNKLDSRYPNTRVRAEASIWIYSGTKNKVKITTNGGASTVLNLEAGKFKIYQIPGKAVVDSVNTKVARSFKIEADFPVIVYCYFAHIQGLEAWRPLPVTAWGQRYHAASIPGDVVKDVGNVSANGVQSVSKPSPAEILVIAAYDNTHITLTPPVGAQFTGTTPATVTLNEGEVYQVQSRVLASDDAEGQEDIAATVIASDKPVGVISGNARARPNPDEHGVLDNVYKNMMIEWLSPDELLGTEHVFMPTWDSHRAGIGAAAERKWEYVRVYNPSTVRQSGYYLQPGGNTPVPFNIKRDTLIEITLGAPMATFFKTAAPSQVMMNSSSIVQFNGSTPCGSAFCKSYSAWAPYMVTLAPREQWTDFAPYYAPPNPGGMQHFINVVTDTNSATKIMRENGTPFLFNRRIAGTDLIWGSMSVTQGEDHWLAGQNGAKFWGFVYGEFQGGEELRPNSGEYEEYNALAYGYPLASANNVLRPADSLKIDSTIDCSVMTLKIRALNADPVGLASVTLDPASARNVKLTPVNPARLGDIIGMSNVELKVEPIDPLDDAQGMVIIKDRTGKVWIVYYRYEATRVDINPNQLINFGAVASGSSSSKTVTITNPMARPLDVKEIRLAIGGRGFTIDSTRPDGPAHTPNPQMVTLAPGASLTAYLSARPDTSDRIFTDTLKITFDCVTKDVVLMAESRMPKIHLPDLDFGTLILGKDGPKTLALEVCNRGGGELRFDRPGDPDATHLIEVHGDSVFAIWAFEVARLKDTVLEPNECYTVNVTFTPTKPGVFRTVARYWASTRDDRDTSVWTARVENLLDAPLAGVSANDLRVGTYGAAAMIRSTLAAPADVRIELFDASGRFVALLDEGHREAGTRVLLWDGAGHASGVYYCRMTAGSWTRTAPVVLVR